MDKTKFTDRPGDSEGFVERTIVDLRPMFDGEAGTYSDVKCNTCSPWALLDQDHLDRIHQIWVNSAERYRQQLADWYYEAQTEAKL